MFITLEEAKRLINEGKILHIAADESLLDQLPKGNWIGGTTPYFITEKGGITCKDKLLADVMDCALDCKISVYDEGNVFDITKDAFYNGLTFLIMPFASEVAIYYSKEAPEVDNLLMTPIIGWISGFDLSSDSKAKAYDGSNGMSYDNKAIALHISLPDEKTASLGIVNIFDPDNDAPEIEFPESSLSVKNCLINGKEVIFADYIKENNIDTQLPLVADYNSVLVNVSIKAVSPESKTVDFYAPVFSGKTYRFARPVGDYAKAFDKCLEGYSDTKPVFSCNCILNYLYGKLEGKATPPFAGPVTFGEVAYQLLNQTLVYAEIIDK